MPQVKPELETFARIKVIGVGGGGCHAVTRMVEKKIRGVDFVAVNCDAQDLHQAKAGTKIHIGKNLSKGLGAGMNPEIGRQAAEENRDEMADAVKGADMVFVTYGLGGGTGTGGGPIVAEVAKESGALTVGVVTKPFGFEGAQRSRIAEEGWAKLRDRVDALITIPNDRLLNLVDKNTSLLSAFHVCDDVLRQAVQGISDLITLPGLINVDFADVRAVMADAGSAIMGVGIASGEDRALAAARSAVSSPLLDIAIDGARGVLFNVSGGPDMTMWEINEAAKVITDSIDKDAKLIFGAVEDERLKKGELKITVIATGFSGLAPKPVEVQKKAAVNGAAVKVPAGVAVKAESEEEEWDAVPAFLRRRK
ncbi:MAG: cell division protein FtsZ [Candidatus Sungbacteria bacterium]|uniref:Cell division protein FtsZ n=1 Tax=Candidatus Sungiibacteriota bacterium TaxID=2750080 RepID=A0A932YXZ7_9BACT|nr:cell division protein FtsZ [Candidatus Sungbacteria bacterium]